MALVHEQNLIRRANRRQAVRNDEGGAVLAQIIHSLLHLFFSLDVERASRFVEHEDRRILQDRAGNCQTLAFTTRKLRTAFADDRVVTIGLSKNEVVGCGSLGCGMDFFMRGVFTTDADIFLDGTVEEASILKHGGNRMT
jgi:hypothetical protein